MKRLHKSPFVDHRQELFLKMLEGFEGIFNYNPFYVVANGIRSLYFALGKINYDLIVMDGDAYLMIVFGPSFLFAEEIVMAADNTTIEQLIGPFLPNKVAALLDVVKIPQRIRWARSLPLKIAIDN